MFEYLLKPKLDTEIYERRITAFVDLLGFKNRVINSEKASAIDEEAKVILNVLKTIKSVKDILHGNEPLLDPEFYKICDENGRKIYSIDGFEFSFFSDCFVLTGDINTIPIIKLYLGFMPRGGITFDYLYHNDNVVFGTALIESYTIEQKIAKFPRILIHSSLIDVLSNFAYYVFSDTEPPKRFSRLNSFALLESQSSGEFIVLDDDNNAYLDWIGYILHIKRKYNDEKIIKMIEQIKINIENNISHIDDSIAEKYRYLHESFKVAETRK